MRDKLMLAALSLGHTVTHWHVAAFYLILPYIAQDFALSFSQAGMLVAVRTVVSASANLPAGAISDMFGRKRLMMAVAVFWPAIFYFAVGTADSYGIILIASALIGFGSSLWHAPAMSTLSDRFPLKKGFALSMHEWGANLGDFVAPVAIGFLLTIMTWRFAIFSNILPAILIAVFIWFVAPKGQRRGATSLSWDQYRQALRAMLVNRRLLAVSGISAARTMGQNALNTFLPIYLAFELGLSPATVGMYVGLLTFASLFSGPFVGTLSDTTGRKPILTLSTIISAILVFSLAIFRTDLPFIGALVLLGLFLYSMRPVIFAYALDITPKEMGSTTVSFVFGMNQIFSALSPIVAGFIADRYGLIYTFYFVAVLMLLGCITTLFLPSRRDELAERQAAMETPR